MQWIFFSLSHVWVFYVSHLYSLTSCFPFPFWTIVSWNCFYFKQLLFNPSHCSTGWSSDDDDDEGGVTWQKPAGHCSVKIIHFHPQEELCCASCWSKLEESLNTTGWRRCGATTAVLAMSSRGSAERNMICRANNEHQEESIWSDWGSMQSSMQVNSIHLIYFFDVWTASVPVAVCITYLCSILVALLLSCHRQRTCSRHSINKVLSLIEQLNQRITTFYLSIHISCSRECLKTD